MKKRKLGVVGVVTAALCASLFAGTAFAAGISSSTDLNANWTIPTTPMTNTVWKDAEGNVVAEGTEGATQYKVLTTWAEAWSTSGADYLGVSNSAYYGNGGNGNATITTLKVAQQDTTAGVWATSANVSPNAYNWNSYYNLYATVQNTAGFETELSDWQAMISGANSGAGGTYWDTDSGVWCGFKYRPDVVVGSNNLSESNAAIYISQIREGHYSATATADGGTYYPDPEEGTDDQYDSSYYVWGDENYDPAIMSYNNNSPYSFVASGYQLAELSQAVIDANYDEDGNANYPGLDEGEAVTWKTVQKMPRSNRYSESVMDCALNIEMLAKGSVYYTLSQIDQGNVDRKKVAYVVYPANYWNKDRDGNPTDQVTPEDKMIVAVYDYTENIGTGPMDGRTSWTSLTVDQLGADGSLEVQTAKTGGSSVGENDTESSTTTYTLYWADADDIASCDVLYCSPNVTETATELQDWISKYTTTTELGNRAAEISYLTTWPVVTNGSNYTFEKFIYGAFGMDFIYPELFPSMELSCYWCDACYHLTDASITSAMSWIYSTASLPAGATLSDIPATYSRSHLLAKFVEGLDYFNNNKNTDPTISRVLSNTALDGSTTYGDDNPYVFQGFEPTDYWQTTEVYVAPDTSDLEAAIAEAEEIMASGTSYTQGSQDALEVALAEAQEVLADANNAYADQAEVDAATAALEDAIAALQTQFTDVTDPNQYYYDAVYNMVALGAITGYENGSFGVGDSMSRAQLVTIMWRYCEPEEYATYDEKNSKNESGLSDVPDGQYYTGAVNWAVKNGVVTGYEDGRFGPDDSITFDQMTTVVARYTLGFDAAADYNTSALENGSFTDKSAVEDYARGPMSWAIENGLITGNNNGDGTYTLDPVSDVARERATTVLWRAIEGGQI